MGFSLKTLGRSFLGAAGGFLVGGPAGAAVGFKAGLNQGKKFETRRMDADVGEASAAARQAAHDAEVAQLAKDALGPAALRKRRGSYATRLTGTPTMGSNFEATGKTLLSQ